jgi:hypothetical protein
MQTGAKGTGAVRVRPIRLADALVKALGVEGTGSLMISVGDDGKVASVESRWRFSRQALSELEPVAIAEEP